MATISDHRMPVGVGLLKHTFQGASVLRLNGKLYGTKPGAITQSDRHSSFLACPLKPSFHAILGRKGGGHGTDSSKVLEVDRGLNEATPVHPLGKDSPLCVGDGSLVRVWQVWCRDYTARKAR